MSAVSFLDSQGSFLEVGTLGESVYSCRGACLQVFKKQNFCVNLHCSRVMFVHIRVISELRPKFPKAGFPDLFPVQWCKII